MRRLARLVRATKTAIDSNGRGCRPSQARAATRHRCGSEPAAIARRRCACAASQDGSLSLRERARVREAPQCGCLCYLWLQRTLRSRLIVCVMSLMAQGAHRGGQSPPPLYPRAPASNIAAARSLRLIPAGFGSGRGSVPAKHGPQPASMRAAPAFRERLSDVEAVSTGSFSKKSE